MRANTQPIEDPETYSEFSPRLDESNHLHQCCECGHLSGDPRSHNFLARCPGCERIVRFYRIIE